MVSAALANRPDKGVEIAGPPGDPPPALWPETGGSCWPSPLAAACPGEQVSAARRPPCPGAHTCSQCTHSLEPRQSRVPSLPTVSVLVCPSSPSSPCGGGPSPPPAPCGDPRPPPPPCGDPSPPPPPCGDPSPPPPPCGDPPAPLPHRVETPAPLPHRVETSAPLPHRVETPGPLPHRVETPSPPPPPCGDPRPPPPPCGDLSPPPPPCGDPSPPHPPCGDPSPPPPLCGAPSLPLSPAGDPCSQVLFLPCVGRAFTCRWGEVWGGPLCPCAPPDCRVGPGGLPAWTHGPVGQAGVGPEDTSWQGAPWPSVQGSRHLPCPLASGLWVFSLLPGVAAWPPSQGRLAPDRRGGWAVGWGRPGFPQGPSRSP